MLHSLGPKSLRHGESNQDEMVGQSDSPSILRPKVLGGRKGTSSLTSENPASSLIVTPPLSNAVYEANSLRRQGRPSLAPFHSFLACLLGHPTRGLRSL